MRARGLVPTSWCWWSADDDVMPQTVEAINHAKAAKVPMIVAINKIDKPTPARARAHGMRSARCRSKRSAATSSTSNCQRQKTNIDKLLEMIEPGRNPRPESQLDAGRRRHRDRGKLDRGRGPVATVLIQRRPAYRRSHRRRRRGAASVPWSAAGRGVRRPAIGPVEVLGFAGTRRAIASRWSIPRPALAHRLPCPPETRQHDRRNTGMRGSPADDVQQKTTGRKEFPLIVRADVQGSLEAIVGSLGELGTDEVAARVPTPASAASPVRCDTVSFARRRDHRLQRSRPQKRANSERDGVEIRYYNIIYDLVDDVKKAMSGLLTPERREPCSATLIWKSSMSPGSARLQLPCHRRPGRRGAGVRLIRDVVVHEASSASLSASRTTREVTAGQECGMAFENRTCGKATSSSVIGWKRSAPL
jgi:translation initiation factor IF-2